MLVHHRTYQPNLIALLETETLVYRLADNCQILAVRSDNCQWGQLSVGTTVSGDNCQWRQLSVETTVSGDNCQWRQLSVGTAVSGPTVSGNCKCFPGTETTVRSYSFFRALTVFSDSCPWPTDSCPTDSCPIWQLSDLTVVRSDSCLIWQLSDLTANIWQLSPNRSKTQHGEARGSVSTRSIQIPES